MRLNYGMQQWYRDHGIEPCCGMCRYFGDAPARPDSSVRVCARVGGKERLVDERDVCYAPERAPGADDE